MESKLLNIEEAARYLGMPVSRIRYETFIKRIPFIKIGRSVRYIKEQLDAWIESHMEGGKDE